MLEFHAQDFFRASLAIERAQATVEARRAGDRSRAENIKDEKMADSLRFHMKNIEMLRESLVVLGAQLTMLRTDALIERMNDGKRMSFEELKDFYRDIKLRLVDELSLVKFFVVQPDMGKYLNPNEPIWGMEVNERFPSLTYEIEEASKCMALGRSTAATFHSIRCLEGGIRALSRCLKISDPVKAAERNWGNMLKNLKGEIDRRWPTATDRLTGDGQVFDDAYTALAAIQNPWRNATMHLDQKYTLEEARHIFDVVGGLMKKLASRCDENGDPEV